MTTSTRRRASRDERHVDTRGVVTHTRLAVALFALAFAMASAAVFGPLVAGVIRYHVSEGATNQIRGGDVAVLVLAVPVSIAAGILILRDRLAGPVLALGPGVYALYMYSQLALGGDVFRYPGNSERFFLLFLAIFLLAGWIVVEAWKAIGEQELPPISRRLRRVFGWFSLVVMFFLVMGLHLPGLIDAWSDRPVGPEYLADPVVFWLVKFMDLGLVVPAVTAVAVGALWNRAWAVDAMYAVVGWIALLGSSVAGMAIVMQATGDPAASVGNTIAFVSFAIVALGVAVGVFRPVIANPDPAQ